MNEEHAATSGEFVRLLWRRKWQLVIPVVIAAAIAYGVSAQQPPVYEAHAELLFESTADGGDQAVSGDVPTEARIVASPDVTMAAAESLSGAATPTEVATAVSAEPVDTLPLLRVTGRAPSGRRAEKLVSATVEAYLSNRAERIDQQQQTALTEATQHLDDVADELDSVTRELAAAERRDPEASSTLALRARRDQLVSRLALQQGRLDELQRGAAQAADVTVLVPAEAPVAPRSPQPVQAGAIGALIGLLVGVALVLVRQQLNDPIDGLDEIGDVLAAPALTVVPRIHGRRERQEIALRQAPTSPAAEAYRILRANLAAAGVGVEHRILLVTSAMEKEGKTTTAVNLAIAFAETGEQVVLVDADLRKPALHQLLGVANEHGLADHLAADPARTGSLVTVESAAGRLDLLPAGTDRREPIRTLSSRQLGSVFTGLRESAIVIVDSPPALPVADATMLAGHADAVLLAVDTSRSNRAALERLHSRLTAVGAPVIGFALHAAGTEHSDYRGYHYRACQEPAAAEPRRFGRRSDRSSPTPGGWST